jgi:hypothetical protein
MLIRTGKNLLLVIACCCSLVGIAIIARFLTTPEEKDLQQGYLLAQAMVHGVYPYLPSPELAKIWMPEHLFFGLPHPTPHPFTVGWLCLPLTPFRFAQAAVVWLLFQLVCLAICMVTLFRIVGLDLKKWRIVAIYLLMLGWWPLIVELSWGQLNMCLMILFLGAWQSLRQGKDGLAGALLGGMLLVKLAGWPILLWLALRRRWRAVWAAGLFWAGAHLLAIGLHGWGMVRDYYLKVGPQVGAIYRVYFVNLSTWTIGRRLFGYTGRDLDSAPLWESPFLVKALTLLAPAIVLTLALIVAMRARRFDTAITLLMAISPVLNPIAWQHCFLQATPALLLLSLRLRELRWPRRMTLVVVLLLIAISVPHTDYIYLAKLFNPSFVPTLPALLTLVPLVALFLLLLSLARLDMSGDQQAIGSGDAIALVKTGESVLTAK